MLKLSEYRTAFKFEGRSARNFADWLRTDRESNPETIENEIAYDPEFVRLCLRKRLARIEKSYPDSFPYVLKFVNGSDIFSISATVEPDASPVEPDAEPIKIEPHETENTIETSNTDTETTDIGSPVTQQPDIETEHETETDIVEDLGNDRIDKFPELDPQTIADRPEPESVQEHSGSNDTTESVTESKFRRMLTNPETMLFGTVAVIFVFLPFTVLNLKQYIAIETNSVLGDAFIWILCFGIAFVWDFSILLFAVNGKHRISQIGAGVLFVFMASKFDFFKRIFDLFGADGEWWQLMFVLSAIVFYSPVLIHQYTKLSVKNE